MSKWLQSACKTSLRGENDVYYVFGVKVHGHEKSKEDAKKYFIAMLTTWAHFLFQTILHTSRVFIIHARGHTYCKSGGAFTRLSSCRKDSLVWREGPGLGFDKLYMPFITLGLFLIVSTAMVILGRVGAKMRYSCFLKWWVNMAVSVSFLSLLAFLNFLNGLCL